MTVSAQDAFNRANGALGTADVGGAWAVLTGSVTISGNRAVTTNARAIAVLDAGAGGYDATVDVDCGSGQLKGGYALYFRVSDVSNWWRLAVVASSSTYVTSYSTLYHTDGTCVYNADNSLAHNWYNSSWSDYPGIPVAHQTGNEPGIHPQTFNNYTTSEPNYATSYTWTLTLEKCAAGTVSTVSSANVDAPTHLRIVALGNSITGHCSTTSDATVRQQITVADSFNLTATKHGIGYAETSPNGNTDGLDNFAVSNANTAPTAPTLTYPTGSVTVDRAQPLRLSWTFLDPDSNDAQSKFDLQYRVGTGAWTSLTGTGGNQFYDMTGGTLAAGNYEWQARTYDRQGLASPWSSSGFFTAASVPAGPTISSPVDGSTISQNSATVTWTTSTQQSYQVRKVADNAGSPNTATVYYDSAEIVSSTDRSLTVAFPTNARPEHVQVRVKNSGLWSPWASVRVTVSFTPPPTPNSSLSTRPAFGAVDVQILNPLPGTGVPSVVSNDIYVRCTATSPRPDQARPFTTDGVRIATGVLPSTIWTDWSPASGVDYEYRVIAYGANTTSVTSGWNATASTPGIYSDTYLEAY